MCCFMVAFVGEDFCCPKMNTLFVKDNIHMRVIFIILVSFSPGWIYWPNPVIRERTVCVGRRSSSIRCGLFEEADG